MTSDHRTALATALGLIISFALGFAGQWAVAEGVWQAWHLLPGLLIATGVGVLTRALRLILMFEGEDRKVYRNIVRLFSVGVWLTFGGFMSTIVIEAGRQWFVGPPDSEIIRQFARPHVDERAIDVLRVPKEAETVIVYADKSGATRTEILTLVMTTQGWIERERKASTARVPATK